MSKTKMIYILHKSHLVKYQKLGHDRCNRCERHFQENDVVATTSRRRLYCYDCATKIHLASGNMKKDLALDTFFSKSTNQLSELSDRIKASTKTKKLALGMLQELYNVQEFFTRNISILITGLVHLACCINNQNKLKTIHEITKVENHIIKWSCSRIVKLLEHSSILSLAGMI